MSLLKRLRVGLSAIFAPFKKSSNHVKTSYLFPSRNTLETVTALGTMIALDPGRLEELRHCRVTKLVHRKARAGPQHELLEVYYTYDPDGRRGCLIVECIVRQEDKNQSDLTLHSTSSLPVPASLDQSTASDPSSPTAYDCVILPKQGKYKYLRVPRTHVTLCALDIQESHPLYMIDFVILLPIITTIAPHYKLLSKQYYWYAHTVYKFFQTHHEHATHNTDQHSKRAGFMNDIHISASAPPHMLEEIKREYDKKKIDVARRKTKTEIELEKIYQAREDVHTLRESIARLHTTQKSIAQLHSIQESLAPLKRDHIEVMADRVMARNTSEQLN